MSQQALSPSQFSTLLSIADAFVPALNEQEKHHVSTAVSPTVASRSAINDFLSESAQDSSEFKLFLNSLILRLPAKTKADVGTLLDLLGRSGIVQLLLSGKWTAFPNLPRAQREAILRKWSLSWFPFYNTIFVNLKKVVFTAYLRSSPLAYDAIGYPVKDPQSNDPVRFAAKNFHKFSFIECPAEMEADIVIVGSGCGAGVVAAKLTKQLKGKRVVIIEKGSFVPQEELPVKEEDVGRLYDGDIGVLVTQDTLGAILTGSTWGGGGAVNFSGALELPEDIRKEWATKHEVTFATTLDFQECFNRVSERMGVSTDAIKHNLPNEALRCGAEKLGMTSHPIPQNTDGNEHPCGYCGYGCRYGEKQAGTVSWLVDAENAGAKCIQNCTASRILFNKENDVTGIKATIKNVDDSEPREILIKCGTVVCCGGTFGTPCFLERSGVKHPSLGKNLRVHPAHQVYGVYEQEMKPWEGSIMTTLINDFASLDGNGYGVKLMNMFFPPGLTGYLHPWTSAEQWRANILRYNNMACTAVICRDRDSSGTVHNDPATDQPIINYNLKPFDQNSLLEGNIAACKVHLAAGAIEVQPMFPDNAPSYRAEENNWDAYEAKLRKLGAGKTWGAAHPGGTCRIGEVVDLEGRVKGYNGVWVADASLLPTATGVNPMLTLMALSDWVSEAIVKDLK